MMLRGKNGVSALSLWIEADMADGLRLWPFLALGGDVGGECDLVEELEEAMERAASEEDRSRILFRTSDLPSPSDDCS